MREEKARFSLLLAYHDLSGQILPEDITHQLSLFADLMLDRALCYLLWEAAQRGNLSSDAAAGYCLLAVGKHGACDVNYSSDLDLIAVYDADSTPYIGSKSASSFWVRLTQKLTDMMEDRSPGGYVFRIDFRLRPNPSATAVAISIASAERYYQSTAVNWERAAMIKARFVTGDARLGEAYLAMISRWVWRRSMDFSAVDDILALRERLHHFYDLSDKVFAAFDVKIGPGGIRDIEFYIQIFQLLHGGRQPLLRQPHTLRALDRLKEAALISEDDRHTMQTAYRFWRMLEHRIQMMADQQTHAIPQAVTEQQKLAALCGFDDTDALQAAVLEVCQAVLSVSEHWLRSESDGEGAAPRLPSSASSMAFDLEKMGFADIASVQAVIDTWRSGRYRSLRAARSKAAFEACLPALLKAFGAVSDPDKAVMRLDKWIGSLPAGVQLFSLLQANPALFRLVARIMCFAPALAETLARHAALWDTVLEPDFFRPICGGASIADALEAELANSVSYEDTLDRVRYFCAEVRFKIGVHMLEGVSSIPDCMRHLSDLADAIVLRLASALEQKFAEKHGGFGDGAGLIVMAMGRFGGQGLTHSSDLDIIYLYHIPGTAAQSDGQRPLAPSRYFSRMAQQLTTALSALTSAGPLYEVDTRLRPSGSQGPLAVTLTTFQRYYAVSAWTWEHMALTRLRPLIYPAQEADLLTSVLDRARCHGRDNNALREDIVAMRQRLRAQSPPCSDLDVKHAHGGLIDVEFIVQFWLLRYGPDAPSLYHPQIEVALERLSGAGVMNEAAARQLWAAYEFQISILGVLRLCWDDGIPASNQIPRDLQEILVKACNMTDYPALTERLCQLQARVSDLFQSICGV